MYDVIILLYCRDAINEKILQVLKKINQYCIEKMRNWAAIVDKMKIVHQTIRY